MNTPPEGIRFSSPWRGATVWPGACVGLGVVFGLLGHDLHRPLADPTGRLIGGVMAAAHGAFAFAVVSLLGRALVVAGWDGALAGRRAGPSGRESVGPFLDGPDDASSRDEIDRATRELTEHRQMASRLGRAVVYAVPLAGFVASALGAWPGASWVVAGRPLFVNLGESLFLLLLTLGVVNASEVVAEGWRLLAAAKPPIA